MADSTAIQRASAPLSRAQRGHASILEAAAAVLETSGADSLTIDADEDVAAITHILLGAMYLRARMGQALDPAFIRRTADLIVDGVAP